ncbi:hypothetical protein, partial [Cupriavidus basilensis]|uniref:hypothetical protein n=1 Tax=Cupriavidus basilensis TaxID=68895 RepID=UPI0023E7E444
FDGNSDAAACPIAESASTSVAKGRYFEPILSPYISYYGLHVRIVRLKILERKGFLHSAAEQFP